MVRHNLQCLEEAIMTNALEVLPTVHEARAALSAFKPLPVCKGRPIPDQHFCLPAWSLLEKDKKTVEIVGYKRFKIMNKATRVISVSSPPVVVLTTSHFTVWWCICEFILLAFASHIYTCIHRHMVGRQMPYMKPGN